MEATPAEIEKYLKLLAQTPGRIAAASRGLASARMRLKPDEASWSANEVLAHLRACADVWGKSIEAMVDEDRPRLAYIHPRQWVKKTDYSGLAFSKSFQAFAKQRTALLRTLKRLRTEDWTRSATIQGRQHTVFTQVRRMALHEDAHCEQIRALLNRRTSPQTTRRQRLP